MEPNKQSGDAASSKPTADLEAGLHAVRLGDPSSPQLLNPQQALAPTAAPVERPPPHMPQSPPTATPDMQLPPHQLLIRPEARSYGAVELPPAGDPIRNNNRDWLASVSGRSSFNAPAAPTPSVAPKRSELSVNAEEYRPISQQSSSTPSFGASQGPTSASGPVDLAAHFVRLLKEGREDDRTSVFSKVMGALHIAMVDSVWSVVFIELLNAPRPNELDAIIRAACEGEVSLLGVANSECGVKSLKKLFEVVSQHDKPRQQLINYLLINEGLGLFQHMHGPDLLGIIFAMFDRLDCSIVIQYAIDKFGGVLSSEFGPKSMVECFTAARNLQLQAELQDLEKIILNRTVELAKGEFSTYFLQKVLDRGSDQLKESIRECVIEHLVSLSLDKYGSDVVRACFFQMGSRRLTLLQRVFTVFRDLPDGQLARLVQDCFANLVVSNLLEAGKCESPEETVALARRIQTLPAAGLEQADQTLAVRK